MNRETFRKLQGNEIVNVNNSYKGASSGRQGQIRKIKSKKDGLVQVEFQGRKIADYHYKFLDVVEEEPIRVSKMKTTVDENDLDKEHTDASTTFSDAPDAENKTESPEVEEKDEASTSTETGS